MVRMAAGSKLRVVREELGLSQAEFAEALSLSDPRGNGAQFVRKWETGERPPSGTAIAAIRYLCALHRVYEMPELPDVAARSIRAALPPTLQGKSNG